MLRAIFATLIGCVWLALVSPAADAHAMLERSWPRADETVAAAPTSLRLRFSERIEPSLSEVTLANAEGQAVALGELALAQGNARELVAPVRSPLPPGEYVVSWRIVSADGHPMRGSLRFTVAP